MPIFVHNNKNNKMTLQDLLSIIKQTPESVDFNDVMDVIQENYRYQETEFRNGLTETAVVNAAGTNEGSCKIFAFAQLNKLTQAQTLACFGTFYRIDVLLKPDGTDHQNIRNFIKDGWDGISFSGIALSQLSLSEIGSTV